MIRHIIFDLDQTLIDTSSLKEFRDNRDWRNVYLNIKKTEIYDGMVELLEYLELNNIGISIVTSSPRKYCEKILKVHNLSSKIQTIVAYNDVKKCKPDSEPILKVINLLNNTSIDEILHIGDLPSDTKAAKAAKIISIGSLWGCVDKKSLSDSSPDYLALEPRNIIEIIEGYI